LRSANGIDVSNLTQCNCVYECLSSMSVCANVCAHVRACVCPVQLQSSLRLVDSPSKGSKVYPQTIFLNREQKAFGSIFLQPMCHWVQSNRGSSVFRCVRKIV